MVNVLKAIGSVFKRAVGITKPPVKLQQNVVPFAVSKSIAIKGAQAGIGLLGKAKNVVARQFTNPFAGTTIKQGVINTGKKILGYGTTGALFGMAYTGSKALVTGKSPSVSTIFKSAGHGALAGTNPIGAIAGSAAGTASLFAEKLPQSRWDLSPTFQPQVKTDFQIPQIPDYTDALKAFKEQSIAPINVMMPPQPQAPSVGFNPSISVGGGGSEILPLMLLLGLGAGTAGYALGKRRKRKKKKYKKRRS